MRIQTEDAERRCQAQMEGFRAGKPTSPFSKTQDYDEWLAAMFVLRELEVSPGLQSKDQFVPCLPA
jgi:hypothetical protein